MRWTLGTLCALALGCAREPSLDSLSLQHALRGAPEWAIEAESPELGARLARLFAARSGRPVRAWPVAGSPRDLPRLVLAEHCTSGVSLWLEQLQRAAEALGDAAGFREFLATLERDPAAALVATLPDALHPGQPLTLVLASDESRAYALASRSTFGARPGYRRFRNGVAEREHAFGSASAPLCDFSSAWAEFDAGAGRSQQGAWTVLAAPTVDATLQAEYVDRAAASWARAKGWLGWEVDPPAVLRLHASLDELDRLGLAPELAQASPLALAVDVLLCADADHDDGAVLVSALAREALPRAPEWFVEGLGLAAAGRFYGRDLASWIGRLHAGGAVPEAAALLAEASPVSTLARAPLRAALVEAWLAVHAGEAAELARTDGGGGIAGGAELELAWTTARVEIGARQRAERDELREKRSAGIRLRPSRHGMDLVVPWNARNDERLGRERSLAALAEQQALGADAVALWTQGWVVAPTPELAAEPPALERESELEVLLTARRARSQGLRVTLVPGLLASPSSSFAGWTLTALDTHWRRLFDEFEVRARHQALLAELAGAEILCLGGGVAPASVTLATEKNRWEHPALAERLERWKRAIAAARGVFDGALTFAADSDYELAGIQFWSELDFVSRTAFPPFGFSAQERELDVAGAAALLTGELETLCRVARAHERRALLLGFGLSSTREGWRDTGWPAGEGDVRAQELGYEVLAGALAQTQRRTRELAGVFVWNWSTGASLDPRGYSPQGKPALAVLERLWRRP